MSPLKSWQDLLNDAGEAGKAFEPLPAGAYDFTIIEASHGKTGTDKPKYSITCEVEAPSPHAKRRVWHNFVLSTDNNNALAFFFRHMAVLGLDGAFFATNPNDDQIVAALKGKRFIGVVSQREWPAGSGKMQNQIDSFQTPRAGAPGPGVGAPMAPPPAAPPIAPPPVVAAPVAPPVASAPEVALPAVPANIDPWADTTPVAPATPAAAPQAAPAPPPF